jgi:hypothetical protein
VIFKFFLFRLKGDFKTSRLIGSIERNLLSQQRSADFQFIYIFIFKGTTGSFTQEKNRANWETKFEYALSK